MPQILRRLEAEASRVLFKFSHALGGLVLLAEEFNQTRAYPGNRQPNIDGA